MAKDGFDGLGKMRKGEKPEYKPKPHEAKGGQEQAQGAGGGETTTITHHPDGSHTIDGEHHPDHLHMLAHLGHKVTGGDKHHIVHHDGMSAHSHSIDEQGQHTDHGEHNSADDAKQALDTFLGEEAQEPMHQHGGEEQQSEPEYGGL